MKKKLIQCFVILLCLNGCCHKKVNDPIPVTFYETVDPGVILPTFVAIDLQADTDRTRRLLERGNYLKGQVSDTLTVEAKAYINGREANSLFKYLRPNVQPRTRLSDFAFNKSAILGESYLKDTQEVNHILKVFFGNVNIRFRWIPSGIAFGNVNEAIDKRRLMGLVAINNAGKILQINDALPQIIKPEINLFTWFNRSESENRYLVQFSNVDIGKIDSAFNKDVLILFENHIHGHDYYTSGTVNRIVNNSLIVSDEE